jgi:hypothetical protein
MIRAREGDFLETYNRLIFDVKGFVHPSNRIIAFIRYVPCPDGDREKNGVRYRKIYSLVDRYRFLEENHPKYLHYDPVFDEKLSEVHFNDVKHHYDPIKRLIEIKSEKKIDEFEEKGLEIIELINRYSSVPFTKLGISGSLLVGLQRLYSDIDLIVYGSKHSIKAYKAVSELYSDARSGFKKYDYEGLKKLYAFRVKDTKLPFKEFVRHEKRKILQGRFRGNDFYIRCIKDWDEMSEKYGDFLYQSKGYTKLKALICDDTESIFTPCCYEIEDVTISEGVNVKQIREIVSFRGRFCEQVKVGEQILAQGKIEKVISSNETYHRLLLGNKNTDYMISI